MYPLPLPDHVEPLANVPAAETLETFCHHLLLFAEGNKWLFTPEQIGQEFRRYFRAPVPLPVRWVHDRLSEFGIEWEGKPVLPDGLKALAICNESRGRYTIHIPYNPDEEAVSLLHELFEIIYWRCYYHFPHWATHLLETQKAIHPHQMADKFAYAVVIPRPEFKDKVRRTGCDLWDLASHFGIRPNSALTALNFFVSTPCPMFIARLNFRKVDEPEQTSLVFEEEGKQGVIWARFLKSGTGKPRKSWQPVERLGKRFPSKNENIRAVGFALQALHEGREIRVSTNKIIGLTIPGPAYAVARPNSPTCSQLFIQVVPVGYEDILKNDQTRLMEKEAAQNHAASPSPSFGTT